MPTDALTAMIDRAPSAPGCYLFRDGEGTVLYVGKAKVLRHRVRSYLRPDADGRQHIPPMVERAVSVEYIVTATEKEALVLENNLIKLHKTRYNLTLRDDKTYVSLRLNLDHPFPRATVVHKYKKDGATYVGPFASADKLRRTMDALKRVFPLRRCSDHVLRNRTRVCVYHDIGVCCGPCVKGNVTQEAYREMVDGLIDVLKGKNPRVVKDVEARMEAAAQAEDYEGAALLRDQLFALRSTVEAQNVQLGGRESVNRDAVGLHREGSQAQVQVLLYRDDKLVGSTTHVVDAMLPDDELIEQFVGRYYEGERQIPPEVLLPIEVDDPESLGAYISDKAGFEVTVFTPQRGDKLKLVRLANLNAQHSMKDREDKRAQTEAALDALREQLGLENTPRRMECYDVSHFQGEEIVASGVCFVDGEPDKSRYRRYKIKTVGGNDDFASMEEVLRRRLERARADEDFPDLIVIDGGAQQLGRVQKLFDEFNVVGVDLIGLAKARDKSDAASKWGYSSMAPKRVTDERVFLTGREEPVTLVQNSREMFLLMRLRDEAHRFAITFHRERARAQALVSGLDAVAGIGPKRKRALIKRFGSPAQVKLATLEQLMEVEGITRKLAEAIVAHFAKQET